MYSINTLILHLSFQSEEEDLVQQIRTLTKSLSPQMTNERGENISRNILEHLPSHYHYRWPMKEKRISHTTDQNTYQFITTTDDHWKRREYLTQQIRTLTNSLPLQMTNERGETISHNRSEHLPSHYHYRWPMREERRSHTTDQNTYQVVTTTDDQWKRREDLTQPIRTLTKSLPLQMTNERERRSHTTDQNTYQVITTTDDQWERREDLTQPVRTLATIWIMRKEGRPHTADQNTYQVISTTGDQWERKRDFAKQMRTRNKSLPLQVTNERGEKISHKRS